MGNGQSLPGEGGGERGGKKGDPSKGKKKWVPPTPPERVGKKKKKRGTMAGAGSKLPPIAPATKCKLRALKLERVKDWLLMEEEFVARQEAEKASTRDERDEEERSKLDDLREMPLSVGTLEEIIDDNHGIVSSAMGPEYYVNILSFVDKTQLEPGCAVLLHHKHSAVVGVLADDADPMVSVMKVDKAPQESYADVGGLEDQIMEIKEAVELPLTHPELYEDIGLNRRKELFYTVNLGRGRRCWRKRWQTQRARVS